MNNKKILFVLRFIFIGFVVVGLVLAALPSSKLSISLNDKLMHFIAFFVYTSSFSILFFQRANIVLKSVGFAFAFGITIEIMQYFLPWRSTEWQDLVADMLGGALAIPFAYYFQRIQFVRKLVNIQ